MGDVVRVMSREQVVKGDKVIKQGDKGDRFYIVDTGEYDVSLLLLYCCSALARAILHDTYVQGGWVK